MSTALLRLILDAEECIDRNERSFRCEECPAAFNRRDLLLRHQATHAKNTKDGLVGPNRIAERATKACNSCVVSKVKCDNGRPCKRCAKKGLECLTKSSGSSPAPSMVMDESLPPIFASSSEQLDNTTQFGNETRVDNVYLEDPDADAQALLDLYNTTGHNQYNIPAFFEQIMVPAPDFMGVDYMQTPPDLMSWMPEVDWLGQVDIFGTDFAPAMDQVLETHVPQNIATSSAVQPNNSTDQAQEKFDSSSGKRSHAVFRQSAWYYSQTILLS